MWYNNREILNKPFDDDSFVIGYNSGIFLFRYEYDSSTDNLFRDSMYDVIRVKIANNKYFMLENISTETMTLQRVTFMQDNTSFIRTIMKEGYSSSDFEKEYSKSGYNYSEWLLESLREDDEEVRKVLDKSSKSSMRERLVSKNDVGYKSVLKYKKRVTISELSNILDNGIYSVIDEISSLFTLLPMRRDILTVRANTRTFHSYKLEGVLENYSSENYVYQCLYISSPIVSNLNRYFNKSSEKWSEWRINQTVEDTYWLHNSIPVSNYADIPILKRQLAINSIMFVFGNNGSSKSIEFSNALSKYEQNKNNSLREQRNTFYKVGSKFPVDMVYGYDSIRSIDISEYAPNLTSKYNFRDIVDYVGMPNKNKWIGNIQFVKYEMKPDISSDEWFKQWNMQGQGARPGYSVEYSLDRGNDRVSPSIPSFSYINGLSIYWSTDIMHFDVKQGLVIDYNTMEETI